MLFMTIFGEKVFEKKEKKTKQLFFEILHFRFLSIGNPESVTHAT